MIYFEEEYSLDLGFDLEKTTYQIIEKTMEYLGCPYEIDVNIILVDSDQIREINQSHRDKPMITDVLSFPMNEYEVPGDFSWIDEGEGGLFSPEDGSFLLGDIILNLDRVLLQAKEYGHSNLREFSFLIVHSLLHLVGYDHMEDEEQKLMINKQKEIMSYLEIER